MELNTLANTITPISVIVVAVLGYLKSRQTQAKLDDVKITGEENHKMLNSESKARMDYQRALIRALEEKGISVPIDQSIPDAKPIGN